MQTFKEFTTQADLHETTTILDEAKIKYEVQKEEGTSDPSFLTISTPASFILKLNERDFSRAKKVLEEKMDINLDEIDPDYSLMSFSTEELRDVIKNKTEWGDFNYKLAIALLRNKGLDVSESYLKELETARIENLKKYEPSRKGMIVAGYLLAFLGGILGIFIGLQLYRSKKLIPHVGSFYNFSPNDRNHGFAITVISIITTLTIIFTRVIKGIEY